MIQCDPHVPLRIQQMTVSLLTYGVRLDFLCFRVLHSRSPNISPSLFIALVIHGPPTNHGGCSNHMLVFLRLECFFLQNTLGLSHIIEKLAVLSNHEFRFPLLHVIYMSQYQYLCLPTFARCSLAPYKIVVSVPRFTGPRRLINTPSMF